ncbi:MAG: hypothetical protein AB1422_06355 [bacterium]
MGVNFVIMVENLANRTQEEINKKFGGDFIDKFYPEWALFTHKGMNYAKWSSPPRFFVKEEEGERERWEALRKYLVRVKEFFGNGKVMLTNDVCWWGLPSEEEEEPGYYLPGELNREDLKEPDYEKYPELKGIKELEGLTW